MPTAKLAFWSAISRLEGIGQWRRSGNARPLYRDDCYQPRLLRYEHQRCAWHDIESSVIQKAFIMSARLLSARFSPMIRGLPQQTARHIHQARHSSAAGGLLRSDGAIRTARRRIWPIGHNALHNAVAVRNASFARFIPNLVMKFIRIPAMFGGAAIAGLAYIQYQATRMFVGREACDGQC